MILGLFIFFIGLILGCRYNFIVPFFYIFWLTLLPYFVDIIFPFEEIENLFEFRTYAAYYIFTMLGIQITVKYSLFSKLLSRNRDTIFYLLILLIYFTILTVVRHMGFQYFGYLRSNLSSIFLLFYLSINTPKPQHISKFILITLTVQIILGLIQEFTGLGNFSFNSEGNGVVSFLTGSFTGNNLYADFLTFATLILLLESRFKFKGLYKILVCLLFICSAYLIFKSGIRLALGSFLIGVILHLYLNSKTSRLVLYFMVLLIVGVFYFGTSFPLETKVINDWHVTSNTERQSGLLGVFQGWDYLQYSTIFYSWILLSEFFIHNPIFGSGLYFTDYGYGGLVSYLTSNATDVTLALFITEFGVIGILLLYLIFRGIFYVNNKKCFKNELIVPIIVVLLQSITDSGIFDTIIMSYFYLFLFIEGPIKFQKYEADFI